jgi:hypothetical protein
MATDHTTVTMKAKVWHTIQGREVNEGEEYQVPPELVDTLVAQGKAAPVPLEPLPPPAE